ncbi:glycerate kinase [Nocardioides sambongensis]|uniref:glycerate kinase n=1 Tax=Nocardioides sambongensis TaxID=2589074 RepID=UPI0018C87903|nr:glycerate kinase [Nocardioides sambongensis]
MLIAPDSFKGSLSSPEVAAAIERGWLRGDPEATCVRVPLADGGEGTVRALVDATDGRLETRAVTGPAGTPVEAAFGLLGGTGPLTAVVEVAAASGPPPADASPEDAGRATSYGTGELIAAALDLGARRLVLGLGGSACTDGGAGLLQALGARFVDADGSDLGYGGAALGDLAAIDVAGLHPGLADCEVVAACDVDNPLTGPRGAAAVFGPQKGADEGAVALLDAHLTHLAGLVVERFGGDPEVPGSGAAGGIGFAVLAVLGGSLRPGIDIVADAVGLDDLLDELQGEAALVLTGEGCLDGQSLAGKVPFGVLRRARERGLPVVGLAGSLGAGRTRCWRPG